VAVIEILKAKSTRNTQIVNMPRSGTGDILITGFSIKNLHGDDVLSVACGEDIDLVFYYESKNNILKNVSIIISNGVEIDTYYFYLKGWSGINIDAMPNSMKIFDDLRPRDINLEIPISDKSEILTYYEFDCF
jgi:hypothetical protein